ncbi:MAG: ABC transporter ATP-binding protein/permease [Prochlorococcus marinus CUG1439]|uniref:ABC transporter ATP-binding protein n=1 Tax=Prochlorococcus sp. MIT 1314 TaxID=3096220 RepID=UPI001B008006|nr:ABC transporter ATP-binding protein [Prochlorococcus sp. MIT 1314]MCR8538792.1 ABC transporter ATP-binding protein/permease [Prochlorococcus marinus CUG1439]
MKNKNFKFKGKLFLKLKNLIDFDLILILTKFLNGERKFELLGILILMTIASIAEIIALASVLPFLTLVIGGTREFGSGLINTLFELMIGDNTNPIIQKIRVVLIFCGLNIVSGILNLLNEFFYGRISARIGIDLAKKTHSSTFTNNFKNIKIDKPDKITSNLTQDITRTINVYRFYIQMLSSAFQSFSVLFVVLSLKVSETYFFAVILILSYVTLTAFSKRKLRVLSKVIAEVNTNQIASINYSFANARENILRNNLSSIFKAYIKQETKLRLASANTIFFSAFPKYIFGPIGICSIGLFSLILSMRVNSYEILISVVGALALSMQKLLPAMQNIFRMWTGIQSNMAPVYRLKERIKFNNNITNYSKESSTKYSIFKTFPSIEFINCIVKYPSIDKNIRIPNIKLDSLSKVGLIGSSGSGKSTLLDVLAGIIIPTSGEVLLNDRSFKYNQDILRKWRNSIAYLAQDYYLESSTILENILANSDLNKNKLDEVLEVAQVSEFLKKLPNGLDTIVGNRGLLLSGGQRQRIAICRALYRPFSLLILDEATSSLNKKLEKQIINNIFSQYKEKSIIIATHNQNVLESCNEVYDLDKLVKNK